jgi:hypothetical protein
MRLIILVLAVVVGLTPISLEAYAGECEELLLKGLQMQKKSDANMDQIKLLKAKTLIVEGDKDALVKLMEQARGILNEQYELSKKLLAINEVLMSVEGRCGISDEVIQKYVSVHGEFVEKWPRESQRLDDVLEAYRAP